MRILHIIMRLDRAAGTSVFCGEVANGLALTGHEVTIAVLNHGQDDCYPLDPRVKLVSIGALIKAGALYNFDIIHFHALWSPVLHRASRLAHKNRVPVVWSPHGMLTPWAMNNKKWKKILGWWLYQKRDLNKSQLIHVTAQSEKGDVRRLGLDNEVIIAPLGVELKDVSMPMRRSNCKRVLLFVSRVQKKKGLLNLARAWAMLPEKLRREWCVRIVGPDQEEHTEEVKSECYRLGVASDWMFVGPRYGDELQQEYANAGLFVLPTFSENFGSVVIEALAQRVPVVTTKGAPWAELEKWDCGWWIDIGVDPLAETLKAAMSLTDEQRREMGERGRKLVEEKYTWGVVVKTMVAGYKEVLDARA